MSMQYLLVVLNGGFLDILFWDEFTPFFSLFLYINLSIK